MAQITWICNTLGLLILYFVTRIGKEVKFIYHVHLTFKTALKQPESEQGHGVGLWNYDTMKKKETYEIYADVMSTYHLCLHV